MQHLSLLDILSSESLLIKMELMSEMDCIGCFDVDLVEEIVVQ